MATILITGVGRGIGLELCRQAIADGHTVIGSARDSGQAKKLRDNFGGQLTLLEFDVTDAEAVYAAARSLGQAIDILINNAGIIGPKRQSTLDMDFDGFAETLAVNTLAPLRVAQAFLPHLERAERPRLLTISSRMGSMSYAKSDQIAYRASKAAVNKIVQALATDLAPRGIAVASIHPGWVRTDMGGSGADIAPEDSASGILALAGKLTLAETGRFWNYDGNELAW
jgi:NAD(P)-dependent dehydrogenase (short-subunit alcohol dehydrogenase family)